MDKCSNVPSFKGPFGHLHKWAKLRGCWAPGAAGTAPEVLSGKEVRTRKPRPKTRESREFLTRDGRQAGEYLFPLGGARRASAAVVAEVLQAFRAELLLLHATTAAVEKADDAAD